jgi:hypothetical protein
MSNRTTYVRVYDDLSEHPAWEDLDPAHVGLWVLALGYCSRNLTDGHVSARRLAKLGGTDDIVTALVGAGRLHGPDHGCKDCPEVPAGALYVHGYLDHQRSREHVEEVSAKRAEAGRRGGRARHAQAADLQEKQSAKQAGSKTQAEETHRQSTETKNNTRSREAAAVAADFETWWAMYPRKVGKAAAAKAYAKARREVEAVVLVDGLANATQVWRATGTEPQFIPHAATWLNAGRWADEVPLPGTEQVAPVALMQCEVQHIHPRHLWSVGRNRYGCQGVVA